jgi:hypothetical protein
MVDHFIIMPLLLLFYGIYILYLCSDSFLSAKMTRFFFIALLAIAMQVPARPQEAGHTGPSADLTKGRLQISPNGRFLQYANGDPFFYLGETAWELFHRLSFEEAEKFLENRRQKGFTVIQAVILAELDGLKTPSVNGELPLLDLDPTRPNEKYFLFVDSVIKLAAIKGLFIGLLPTWGDKVDRQWGEGPVIFDEQNASLYGKWVGNRYKDFPNIIWIMGGDRGCKGNETVWEALAEGIRSADGNHLMTFHPTGSRSSSECFHEAGWLDFNMHQSGHSDRFIPNYNQILADYARNPAKPCMDGEPIYEAHPFNWNPKYGISNEDDVRRAAYWALFSGAHGHTYGCHCIWQFYSEKVAPINSPPLYWSDAMDLPGAFDMLHLRRLMESRPMLERRPDQSILHSGSAGTSDHIAATQGDGYAFVYLPSNQEVTIDLSRIPGNHFNAWWFNPRNGEATFFREVEGEGRESFRVPVSGIDWVLVIDNSAYNFSEPGKL